MTIIMILMLFFAPPLTSHIADLERQLWPALCAQIMGDLMTDMMVNVSLLVMRRKDGKGRSLWPE